MKNPSIAILDLIGLVYDGSTLSKKGLGGSESAVILMSRELANIGFDVTVFNACDVDDAKSGVYDGVTYRPIESLTTNENYDIMVVSRTVVPFVPEEMYEAFNTATRHPCKLFEGIRKNAKMKILWMHDTFCNGDHAVEDLVMQGYIDKIFTLSDFHTSYISGCDHGGNRRNFEVLKNKIFQTRNGMVKYFDEVDVAAKDRNLFVYNASLTKGMIPLIDHIWPRIKHHIPDAKLKVIGGFYQFRSDAPLDDQGKRHQVISKEKKYKDIGIEFTGVISQKQIAEILTKANFFIFPCAFPETFGISTLEALAYNVPILATRFGALEETAIDKSSYFIDYAIEPNGLFPNINANSQIERFVEMAVRAYHNPYLHQQKQYHCNIIKDVCGWDSVALQWKQFFLNAFKLYMDADEYRKVSYINDKVHRVFGRRFSNNIEWNTRKENTEQKICVISPFYNGKEYLENMIMSVATQDYKNYHHIIIDDCSTDGSYEHITKIISSLPNDLQKKYTIVRNKENMGAVYNQVTKIKPILDSEALIMLLDGDDALMPDNNIFNYYNSLFADGKTEYAYGSCWSMVDNIPLIAQPYPKKIRDAKAYRSHKFNWGMPYPHLRVFKKKLINDIDESVFKNDNGNWFMAGGDNATFYNIIEQANPDKVVAVQDIFYLYNDKNPLNDYKVHGELQNRNAAKITGKQLDKKVEENMEDRVTHFSDWIKNNKKNVEESIVYSTSPVVNDNIDKNDMRVVAAANLMESVRKKKVLIAIPTTKNIEATTFKSIYDQILPDNITAEFQYFYGYNVDQVRNLIANWIVKGDYDYLFAVDYDISFSADTLAKLIAADKDVISGVYRQRFHEHQTLELFEANDRGGFAHMPYEKIKGKTQPIEIGACGFGCALVKKQVMVDIGYPQFKYTSALDHKDTFSEDLDFCRKARAKGFTVWVEPTIICDHTGSYVYRVV
jgi:GT2 family glycosyltransferase/glycosyltransferase involved in cell wall biosynthesis